MKTRVRREQEKQLTENVQCLSCFKVWRGPETGYNPGEKIVTTPEGRHLSHATCPDCMTDEGTFPEYEAEMEARYGKDWRKRLRPGLQYGSGGKND